MSDCGCGPGWRAPKVNGTCGACGGRLPGERPAPLSWLGSDLKRAGEQIKREEAERCPRCGGHVVNPARHGEGWCVDTREEAER